MSGVSFSGKQDLRNLMLAYGDASTPYESRFRLSALKK